MTEVARNASQAFFQHSLAEVVRKLRSQGTGASETDAIETFIADTKKEVSSTVQAVKVAAVQKAMYFQMLGFDSSYANFHVVEIMSDTVFANKRVGYTAACTMFSDETDVIPLMTALLTRDLASTNQYEVGLALYCIASVCTPDLARDLASHVVKLLRHPRTYIRKKAALSLYKVFIQYPEALRPTYPKLKDKLDDEAEDTDTDPAVRGAVVCVLCELARRNPANFLGLAVPFYSLLQTVHSNWTLIKVIKVFGYFAPLEPRLGKKLMEPLTKLITTSGAKSVQYECLLAVANGMSKVPSLTKLAAEKLRGFAQDRDPNLKFLGLDAISRMALEHPKLLADQRDLMVSTLGDADPTIRAKALLILRDLVTQSSITKTINNMFDSCVRTPPEEEWTNLVIKSIVETAQTDDYALIDDFEWYLGLLFDMSVLALTTFEHGRLLDREIVTILTRVSGVRAFGVDALAAFLTDTQLLTCDTALSTQGSVLRAAAFACGEYPHWLKDKKATCEALLSEAVTLLSAEVQLACVTAACKIASFIQQPCPRHCVGEGEESSDEVAVPQDAVTLDDLRAALHTAQPHEKGGTPDTAPATTPTVDLVDQFLHSVHPQVQERAKLLNYILNTNSGVGAALFEKALHGVASGAQTALGVPDGLDLDEPFNADLEATLTLSGSDLDGSDDDDVASNFAADSFDLQQRVEQQRQREEARRREMAAFYLGSDTGQGDGLGEHTAVEGDEAPRDSSSATDPDGRGRQPVRQRHRAPAQGNPKRKVQTITRDLDRPDTYKDTLASAGRPRRSLSPEEDEATRRLRHIDVTRALRPDETLPEVVPYSTSRAANAETGVKAGAGSKARPSTASTAPVDLCATSAVRVRAFVDGCKAHLDGFRLTCVIEVMSLVAEGVLHDVSLVLTDSAVFPATAISWDDPEKRAEGQAETSDASPAAQMSFTITGKLKTGATERRKATLFLAVLPRSFADAAVPMQLTFTQEKRSCVESACLPLRYTYFAKHKNRPVSGSEFNDGILKAMIEAGDEACPTFSAFVACTKTQLLAAMPAIHQQLFLAPVEVFKDTASLHGVLHGRKSHPELAHVAAMLRETTEEGTRGVTVFVRSFYPCLSEALIHDIFATVLSAPPQRERQHK